ncbi:hypothetical protein [Bradyrhizobium zhanjiangense]|uniref:hypothetical protein n=1 Tax=Bradyrhizobium zhanjiangense TaxID=1325107 RepID=UPI001ABEF004|nr:hypothetical protein [Bradyrhizobium zhanjiangense]
MTLALSLPANPAKSLILAATYAVVFFSIIVQRSTLGFVARRTVATQRSRRLNNEPPGSTERVLAARCSVLARLRDEGRARPQSAPRRTSSLGAL